MHTLIVLLGPTAVGKTALSLRIARHLHSPILSADSRQIYRDLPIGTAAPTAAQLSQAKHYFVGTMPLDAYFSAAQYEQAVMELLPTLFRQTDAVLMSGGSMLYIDAVCRGIDDIPTVDADTRAMMKKHLEQDGAQTLLNELRLLDPLTYSRIDLRNTRRVIHALEISYMTGRPYSSFLSHQEKKRPFRIIKIGLNRERADLFLRISQRVDQMMELGLEQEARRVYTLRFGLRKENSDPNPAPTLLNSLNTVGYKELFRYIDGEWTLQQAVEKIKRNTRVYAKKQMTWFRRDQSIHWFHPDEAEAVLRFIDSELSE